MYEGEHQNHIQRHVPRNQINQLHLQQYTVALIEPKNTNKIIQLIKEYEQKINNPIVHSVKPFLKRVNKQQIAGHDTSHVQVLLCPLENHTIINDLLEILKGLVIKTVVVKIPKFAPTTKSDFKEWMKIWPINFIQPEISKEIHHEAEEAEFIYSLAISTAKYPSDFYLFKGMKILAEEEGACLHGTINHPVLRLLAQWPKSPFFANPTPIQAVNEYYYLTGLKMFIRNSSLCGMCSMALVHSRLQSAYFPEPPHQLTEDVMSCPKLNHQINLFVVSVQDKQQVEI